MFKCECCKKDIGPGVSPNRVVTSWRRKGYQQEVKVEGRYEKVLQFVGSGFEIAVEANACEECAPKIEKPYPGVRKSDLVKSIELSEPKTKTVYDEEKKMTWEERRDRYFKEI